MFTSKSDFKKVHFIFWFFDTKSNSKFVFFEARMLQNHAFWTSTIHENFFAFTEWIVSKRDFLDVHFSLKPVCLKNFENQNLIFKKTFSFKNWFLGYKLDSENWQKQKLTSPNLPRCISVISNSVKKKNVCFKFWRVVTIFKSKIDALLKICTKSDTLWNFIPTIWLLSCFSVFDCIVISTVNVNNNLFQRREVKNNLCFRFSHHKYNCKLPHVSRPPNLWE